MTNGLNRTNRPRSQTFAVSPETAAKKARCFTGGSAAELRATPADGDLTLYKYTSVRQYNVTPFSIFTATFSSKSSENRNKNLCFGEYFGILES